MTNPFDDQDAPFLALTNSQGQASFWPGFLPPPPGWQIAAGPAARAEIEAFIKSDTAPPGAWAS